MRSITNVLPHSSSESTWWTHSFVDSVNDVDSVGNVRRRLHVYTPRVVVALLGVLVRFLLTTFMIFVLSCCCCRVDCSELILSVCVTSSGTHTMRRVTSSWRFWQHFQRRCQLRFFFAVAFVSFVRYVNLNFCIIAQGLEQRGMQLLNWSSRLLTSLRAREAHVTFSHDDSMFSC